MKTSKPRKWKEQFLKVKKIGETPPLNRVGFWKRREIKELELETETHK